MGAERRHVLELRIVAPVRGWVQVRPVVDGRDVLAELWAAWSGEDPWVVLGPGGIALAEDGPHEVRLARISCTEICCGALYVTVRREGDEVVWDGWRNPAGGNADLPEFRFDAARYAAEVRRAGQDRAWEWPARTVAGLLAERLRADPGWSRRWECELDAVWTDQAERNRLQLVLIHPDAAADREGRPWLQLGVTLDVGDGDAVAEVDRLAARLASGDRQELAEVWGGSWHHSEDPA
ncbi:hypothetical protein PV721_13945 [Streptomyces sp. MB09-01]|uniref:hypothetical protein n=1 Tax=Streptomyces sp. MB09-01 TaxID=3028666 RepID=UPI0029A15DD1|nr:hypothetical protein [Streptomyces sp. MB09-01]MDX3535453.1 hypothetical protein [Streptomyces sp. MB09-01]